MADAIQGMTASFFCHSPNRFAILGESRNIARTALDCLRILCIQAMTDKKTT